MKAANQVVSFGKQLFSIRYVYSGSDFKPCSHEGSDPQKWYKNNSQRVSIHVPIMGATTEIAQICPLVRVSIHAPTKGALMSPTLRISCSFNPSSHEGSDSAINVDKAEVSMFQSTLPRRERLFVWARIKGDDGVSIHAPTKGATQRQNVGIPDRWVSIHAPTKGATKMAAPDHDLLFVSIHAPTKGATSSGTPRQRPTRVSIHAPTKGATIAPSDIARFSFVSIHAPTKGATDQ